MTDLIPAQPGWYLQESDTDGTYLDPIIAWAPAVDSDGEGVLLPYVAGGPGMPPLLMTIDSFKHCFRNVVYQPDHKPDPIDLAAKAPADS
ncbi:hypothetical protein [Streptomyces erythrochromogenes]|uniref:hypothetical protein n=1 Tax=Streptomyces erythrochromogenes TaxID=285574 RepID=UPI0033DE0836